MVEAEPQEKEADCFTVGGSSKNGNLVNIVLTLMLNRNIIPHQPQFFFDASSSFSSSAKANLIIPRKVE